MLSGGHCIHQLLTLQRLFLRNCDLLSVYLLCHIVIIICISILLFCVICSIGLTDIVREYVFYVFFQNSKNEFLMFS